MVSWHSQFAIMTNGFVDFDPCGHRESFSILDIYSIVCIQCNILKTSRQSTCHWKCTASYSSVIRNVYSEVNIFLKSVLMSLPQIQPWLTIFTADSWLVSSEPHISTEIEEVEKFFARDGFLIMESVQKDTDRDWENPSCYRDIPKKGLFISLWLLMIVKHVVCNMPY